MKKDKWGLKIRIPTPKPTKFHSTRRGAKGYERAKARAEVLFLKRISSLKDAQEK